jgi:hypothetical protein
MYSNVSFTSSMLRARLEKLKFQILSTFLMSVAEHHEKGQEGKIGIF